MIASSTIKHHTTAGFALGAQNGHIPHLPVVVVVLVLVVVVVVVVVVMILVVKLQPTCTIAVLHGTFDRNDH